MSNESQLFIPGGSNSADPTRRDVPANAQQLFTQIVRLASGFTYEDVIDCAANLFINALRQKYPKRRDALEKYAEAVNKTGTLLAGHYDPVTGNRRNIFPFTQTINLDHIRDPDKT